MRRRMTYYEWRERAWISGVTCLVSLVVWYAGAFAINLVLLTYSWAFHLSIITWLAHKSGHAAGYWPDWALTGPVRIALAIWPTFIVLDLIAVTTWLGMKSMMRR